MKAILQNKTLLTYGLILVNLVAIVLFSLLSTTNAIYRTSSSDKVFTIIDLMDKITSELSYSEEDIHRYLVTLEPYYLQKYREKQQPLQEKIDLLEKIIGKNFEEQKKFERWKELVASQISIMESSLKPDIGSFNMAKSVEIPRLVEDVSSKEQSLALSPVPVRDNYMDEIKGLKKKLVEEHKTALRDRQSQSEFTLKSREYVIVSASIASLLISIIAIGTIVTDLNEKREREKYLVAINENKDRFFSLISHDLKGPAQNLIGISELLLNDHALHDEERESFIHLLNQTAKKNYSLLENLLEWSKIQMGGIVMTPVRLTLKRVVEETLEFSEEKIIQKNLTIADLILENQEVFADQNALKTVLRNLVSNAIKFTPDEGTIRIDATQENNNVIISISDNGIGMSASTLSNLFNPGKTVSRYGTQGESGTGLGLLLCKEFVEKNGGKIWAESDEGKGSCFRVVLPLMQRS